VLDVPISGTAAAVPAALRGAAHGTHHSPIHVRHVLSGVVPVVRRRHLCRHQHHLDGTVRVPEGLQPVRQDEPLQVVEVRPAGVDAVQRPVGPGAAARVRRAAGVGPVRQSRPIRVRPAPAPVPGRLRERRVQLSVCVFVSDGCAGGNGKEALRTSTLEGGFGKVLTKMPIHLDPGLWVVLKALGRGALLPVEKLTGPDAFISLLVFPKDQCPGSCWRNRPP
jgi:hypothetical protein